MNSVSYRIFVLVVSISLLIVIIGNYIKPNIDKIETTISVYQPLILNIGIIIAVLVLIQQAIQYAYDSGRFKSKRKRSLK